MFSYDSIDHAEESEAKGSRKRLRRCTWTRFLTFEKRQPLQLSNTNLRCTKHPQNGQVVYETTENIAPNTDLICSAWPQNVPENNDQQMQQVLFKRAMEAFIKGNL